MSTATTTRPQTQNPIQTQREQLPALSGSRLPYHPAAEERFGIDKSGWRVLVDVIFPNATSPESVLLAAMYCKARGLDIFKRPVHIVPIWSKAEGRMVDSIWPGIGEVRTTAHRTKDYAGHDETAFGPDETIKLGTVKLTFPAWAQITVYRMVQGVRCPFPGAKVRWLETYATAGRNKEEPNEMWNNRPYGQLEKCAEAAALRAAFPEEIGNDYIPEEVEGRHFNAGSIIDVQGMTVPHKAAGKVRRSELNDRGPQSDMPDDRRPTKPRDTGAGGSEPGTRHEDGQSIPPSETPPAADPVSGPEDNPADDEERQPGDDDAPPADEYLSPEALALEVLLQNPAIDRKANADILQQVVAGKFTDMEKLYLKGLIKRNTDRLKAKK